MHHRRVKQCIAELTALRKRSDLEPEQKQAIEFALCNLKQLARRQKVQASDVYNCVAQISEKLVNAFCKSKHKL